MKIKIVIIFIFILINAGLLGLVIFVNKSQDRQVQTKKSLVKQQVEQPKKKVLSARIGVTTTLTESGFSPDTLKVIKGTMVIWKNKSGKIASVNSVRIQENSPPNFLDLGEFGNNTVFQVVFSKEGIYKYYNNLIPSQAGTVIVE